MGMKVNGTSGLTFPDTTTLASAGQASVRAWVNFNGTGTVAIRAAYNVTSITDNGTGDYTVNFTTAMPDVNYSASLAMSLPSNIDPQPTLGGTSFPPSQTVGALRVYALADNVLRDADNFHVAIFR